MLATLSIRDVVLIEHLDIDFQAGLCVLTGETGAGKSILLDALGLALGFRAEARLVRDGAEQSVATALFIVADGHPSRIMLHEQGLEIDPGDDLILRRVLGTDGRSRAFVNDQAVSVGLLRRVGESLVEVHGQFDNQRLMSPSAHRTILDAFGGLAADVAGTAAAYEEWRDLAAARSAAAEAFAAAQRDEEDLRHAVAELEALAPEHGEEAALAERRQTLMHGEKLIEAMNEAERQLDGDTGAEPSLQGALAALGRVRDLSGGLLTDAASALQRALAETQEASAALAHASAGLDLDPATLELAEERLFALRAAARKHGAEVDALPRVLAHLSERLSDVEDGGANLARLEEAEAKARAGYVSAAAALSQARRTAMTRLDAGVATELAPLKLGGATFTTSLETIDEADWGAAGMDRVMFQVSTNPGAPPGPLTRIASGGELARFMLALKVVLAEADPVPTLIFDEVDAGIGGAVADAVGERLAALGTAVQVIVVTHSPQVAARGGHHWRVSKQGDADGTATGVEALALEERAEEIARMLAGAKVTDEARAAAHALLAGGAHA